MIQLKVFSTLTILLALASGLPFSLDRQILLPNQDPFYQSPADCTSYVLFFLLSS